MNADGPARVAVVDAQQADLPRLERLREELPAKIFTGDDGPAEIVERAAGAEVLATLYTYTRIGSEVIEALDDLRLVITRTAGHSHIDLAAAGRAGVAVATVPEAPTLAVAEFTIAALMAMGRDLFAASAGTRAGDWRFTEHRSRDIAGRTLGVVGLGGIGAKVAELAQAIGMQVIGWSRRAKDLPGVEQLELAEVMARADFISVNTALTPQTEGMLDAELLRSTKPGAFVINTARGELLDTEALCGLLREGHLAGACLDVLPGEPVARERLLELAEVPNLILTPHVSWHTEGTLERQFQGMTEKIVKFCAGEEIEFVETAAPQ